MGKKPVAFLIAAAVLVYFITLILHISANYTQYQWDFRTHRAAGALFVSGQDPYDPDILFPKAGTRFLYTYPPLTLYFYGLFAALDDQTAFNLFLLVKCMCLLGLVIFWRNAFLGGGSEPLYPVFCLLAFQSAVFRDLIAGNINLFEQLWLWLGFWCFLKGRLIAFALFVWLAAIFKMTPIVFLVLFFFSPHPKRIVYFLASAGAFLVYLLGQYVIFPEAFAAFLRNALVVVGERGGVVPSTYTLLSDAVQMMATGGQTTPHQTVVWVLVCALAAMVLGLTARACIRRQRSGEADFEKMLVFLACLCYGLIHPRFKDYAYMLLLVPTYHLLINVSKTKVFPFLFLLSILSCPQVLLPGLDILSSFFWKYYPLMVAYGVWAVYLCEVSDKTCFFAGPTEPGNSQSAAKKRQEKKRQE